MENDKIMLIAQAKKRYKIGDWVDQKTAYNDPETGEPVGRVFEILSDSVGVEDEIDLKGREYLNVHIDGTGVYNTIDNKWAEIVKSKTK